MRSVYIAKLGVARISSGVVLLKDGGRSRSEGEAAG